MASGGGGHQQQQQHKISPRKFSEKIALLNKKEAEGNAEFEEIIKEVQATRSQTSHQTPSCFTGGNQLNLNPNHRNESTSVGIGNFEINDEGTQNAGCERLVDMDNLTSEQQDELEEVYQNLVKGVKQFGEPHQQQDSSSIQMVDSRNFEETNRHAFEGIRSASAGLSSASNQQGIGVNFIHQTNNLPLNQSPCINIANENNNNDFIPYALQQTTSKFNHNNSNSSINQQYPFYAQEAVNAAANSSLSSCRARGTSIGSAQGHRHCLGANAMQSTRTYYPSCNNNNNNNSGYQGQLQADTDGWFNAANGGNMVEMYLKPAYDSKSCWQKSSSAPTLNDPSCELSSQGHFDQHFGASFSQEHLMMDQAIDLECQQQPITSNKTLDVMEQQENVSPSGSGYDYISSSSYQMSKQNPYLINQNHHHSQNRMRQTVAPVQVVEQLQRDQESTGIIEGIQHQMQYSTTTTSATGTTTNNDNIETIRGDLPGIKICTIEDDNLQQQTTNCSQQQQQQQQQVFESNNILLGDSNQERVSSPSQEPLPDLANLQFTGEGGTIFHDKRNQDAEISDNDNPVMSNNGKWILPQQQQQQPLGQAVDGAPCANNNRSINQIDPIDSTSQCRDQSAICHLGGWSDVSVTGGCPGGLYAEPKVNNLLSNSDCGLSHRLMLNTNDLYNASMIRSHSHSSIDYLTRQKARQSAVNYSNGQQHHQGYHQPHNQHLHHHLLTEQQLHYNRHLQTGGIQRVNNKYSSGSSMRPQHGSISPLDSSSNLTSPQSEQNSPGSSTTEYNELLPFQLQQQQQQQQASVNRKSDDGNSRLPVGTYLVAYSEQDLMCESNTNAGINYVSINQQNQEASYQLSQYNQNQQNSPNEQYQAINQEAVYSLQATQFQQADVSTSLNKQKH